MHGCTPGKLLPPPYCLVAIERINFDEPSLALRSFARDQRRAAAPETVENDIARARAITNGIGDKPDGLCGWMHAERVESIRAERICTAIGPDVAAISSVPAKLNVIG